MGIETAREQNCFSGGTLLKALEPVLPKSSSDLITIVNVIDSDAQFFADLGNIRAAVVLLLNSARSAMPMGGTLTLKVQSAEPSLSEIVVEDTRQVTLGMDHSEAKTFNSTNDGMRPTLSSVHDLVVQSGGEVRLCTNIGVGISVSILLPAK